VSRPDRLHQVAVDFAPPRTTGARKGPLAALVFAILLIGAIGAAVTQLLLR
jgi:hypothetical protein